jgi:hypothetical protein
MDLTFVEGVAAVLSGVIVFCGSVFLLITLVTGARLAYFITACVTLAFCTMMAFVWSGFNPPWVSPTVNPLGPVGTLPSWDEVGIGESPGDIDFEEASPYPDDPWIKPDTEDPLESAQASTLKNEATDVLEEHIKAGDFKEYTDVGDLLVDEEKVRLLHQGEAAYGGVTFSPLEEGEGPDVIVMAKYDPGNPLKPARRLAAGFFIAFLLHLLGLWLMERRARRVVVVEETEVERT